MILEIYIDGFRFFKKDTMLSFSADARTKRLLSNAIFVDGKYVNKCVGIYGSNNSGKSNLIKLFSILKAVLSGSENFVINRAIFCDQPLTSISITYNNLDGKGWLKYDFTYDYTEKRFVREKLSSLTYYPNGKPFEKTLFEKDFQNKIFEVFGSSKVEYLGIIRGNLPLFYVVELESGIFSTLKEYKESFQQLASSIEVVNMFNIPISKTIDLLKRDHQEKKDFILSFVKHADLSVSDFKYDKADMKYDVDGEKIDEKALEGFEDLVDSIHLKTRYGNVDVPSLFFDSSGTKKIEAVAAYIYEAIKEGKILVIDELDNGLHYKLTRAIVSLFNNLLNKKGQLVFTAHDLLLIDCNYLMRKDQIYFTQRDKKCASLFCLKEATVASGGPREGTDLIKRYNRGDFVEVPSPSFIEQIIKIVEAEGENANKLDMIITRMQG